MWLIAAVGSALFAGLTTIFAKCGIRKTNSDLATALRTVVVLLSSIIMVILVGSYEEISNIGGKSWLYLILSGAATGASWLCYYYAVQNGVLSAVVPIDKMSILITVLFSVMILKEKISKKAVIGLLLMCIGTLAMVFAG